MDSPQRNWVDLQSSEETIVETAGVGLIIDHDRTSQSDPELPAQRRERSLRSLYCCSDGVRGRGAPATCLSHSASFHSNERIAPSDRGIKHLAILAVIPSAPSNGEAQ